MEAVNSIYDGNKCLVSVRAYHGDAMTMLAFDLDESLLEDFIGFSIKIQPGKLMPYFLFNKLSFNPDILKKNNISEQQAKSTEFSPIQKFNWLHAPSVQHNIGHPYFGDYTYEVTPRYLRGDILEPLDPAKTVRVTIDVSPFKKGNFQLGFTRGFVASQAYVDHFGMNNAVRPNKKDLIFDLKQQSGPKKGEKDKSIQPYTFEDQFAWMGWQARERVYEILKETLQNKDLTLDVFAYDLNEPFVCDTLLALAKEGRVKIILDNASLHTGKDKKGNKAFEDVFEQLFKKQAQNPDDLVRGKFGRFSHDKIFIQKLNTVPVKILTGSTNFSTNGLYINANHVLIFTDSDVAKLYDEVFNESFGAAKMKAFSKTSLAQTDHPFQMTTTMPKMILRFSPHTAAIAKKEIDGIAKQVKAASSDLLFAIMNDTTGSGSLLKEIRKAHARTDVFSYGIVDKSKDITLYKPNKKTGVRVAGAGINSQLPPPFKDENKIPGVSIHHKFIVVDFKTDHSVVYCGSSNLAEGGEKANGDNLLEIRDRDIVTVFAVEALRLVDHFHWRNKKSDAKKKKTTLYLYDNGDPKKIWHTNYYDPEDMRCLERQLLISDTKE
jgi:phosphatidylserine/phosphatidylglycerophosphate/cardiolipin synthase-like enzyme